KIAKSRRMHCLFANWAGISSRSSSTRQRSTPSAPFQMYGAGHSAVFLADGTVIHAAEKGDDWANSLSSFDSREAIVYADVPVDNKSTYRPDEPSSESDCSLTFEFLPSLAIERICAHLSP